MKLSKVLLALAFLLVVSPSHAHDARLLRSAQAAWPRATPGELAAYLRSGIWHTRNSALAVSAASKSYIFVARPDGSYLAVDVSRIEAINLGKPGMSGKASYKHVKTSPVRWLDRDDGPFAILFRITAWKAGKKYAPEEPLVILRDGTVVWR